MTQDALIRDVSDTAFMVAAYRALEGERPDALFHDPLAKTLAGEQGRRIVEAMARGRGRVRDRGWDRGWGRGGGEGAAALRMRIMTWVMAIRTRLIDELILTAIAQGADAIVNLGAGLDTRPYRLALPESLVWIEADLPRLIDYKDQQLSHQQPRCRLERARLDLRDLGARSQFLHALGLRFRDVLVLTEGVVPYLTPEDVGRLAEDLRAQPACRRWIVDYMSSRVMRYRGRATLRWMRNAPFLFLPEDYFRFFRVRGWHAQEVRPLWEEARRLGRPLQLPWAARLLLGLRRLLLSRKAREARRNLMAYVLFVPTTPDST